ncbi:hypothetical protein MHBO_003695, partial [Bonamia ostreae]
MSSLAAARADNFYHPPDWDPKKSSRNKFQKSRGRNQYEQKHMVRFEMPFNIVCDGKKRNVEEHHIGAGTRYNARKMAVGFYFSTQLWEFDMCCHQCGNKIIIKTDPKNRAYEITKGGRIRIEKYSAEAAKVLKPVDPELMEKRDKDKMFALERDTEQKMATADKKKEIAKIFSNRMNRKNDYDLARKLRKRFNKNSVKEKIRNFNGVLLPVEKDDVTRAKIFRLKNGLKRDKKRFAKIKALQKVKMATEPIFGYKKGLSKKAKTEIRSKRLLVERNIKLCKF